LQSERRLIRTIETNAPRGNIYDRNGAILATTETTYDLCLYRTKKNSEELNETLLKLMEILEKNGDSIDFSFPIDFEEMKYLKSENAINNFKKENNINESASIEEIIEFIKEKYKIDESKTFDEIKKIIMLRYEIQIKGFSSYKPITIASNISSLSMQEIEENNNELSGILFLTKPIRKYLEGSTASHILGYVGSISENEYKEKKELGYSLNDKIGKTGIESSFEEYLRGKNGTKRIEMDSLGRINDEDEIEESIMGDDVYLTIDLELQKTTEQELKNIIDEIRQGKINDVKYKDAKAGSAVVLDVKTGEVLAMASYPDYYPNDFIDGISQAEYEKYFNNQDKPLYNRSIQGVYPPGSTFKMVTGIAGIESGKIDVLEKVNDTGVFYLGHKPACWIWNSRRQTHGLVDSKSALMVSCNYYYYEVGSRIGIDTLSSYARKFGLGEKTGIELFGESKGTVASKEYVKELNEKGNNKVWTIGDTLSASIGQSYNLFTPIQMCYYISTIANKGKKTDLTILNKIVDSSGNELDKNNIKRNIDEKLGVIDKVNEDIEIQDSTIEAIFEGMRSVTGDRGGTVYGTFNDFPVEVAGKTGTATSGNGDDNAWFVGFAPYDDPKIAVVIIVEHGGHGYYTARAVKNIMSTYFGFNEEDKLENN